jgi:hypothetical protein
VAYKTFCIVAPATSANMSRVPWNINTLATFVSLGGLFFGMDTDKTLCFADIESSVIDIVFPVYTLDRTRDGHASFSRNVPRSEK